MQAKRQLALMNELDLQKGTFDFVGTETDRFMKFFEFIQEYQIKSICNSDYCQAKEITQTVFSIPSISNNGAICSSKFTEAVIHWVSGSWDAPCKRSFEEL